jgi:cystathionine beta-lyase family protein involved in aluminum resistance
MGRPHPAPPGDGLSLNHLERFGIARRLLRLAEQVEEEIQPALLGIGGIAAVNHARVLAAFQEVRVSPWHFAETSGYGLGDAGRQALDEVYARAFGAEAALVRTQIVSGTHAIGLCLFGILRPGDRLVSLTGRPYDTLLGAIGIRPGTPASLRELGVEYRQACCLTRGEIDGEGVAALLEDSRPGRTLALIQRARGYDSGPGVTVAQIAELTRVVARARPDAIVLVDNCYAEFIDRAEPPEVGAHLVAGSLIKNPGGGLAPCGGYVAGRRDLVELAAGRLTLPGLGGELGATPPWGRLLFQGLYLAPAMVGTAMAGAVFASRFFERLGFSASPGWDEPRTDIVQAVELGTRERVLAFLRGVQRASPVDAFVTPEPGSLPGYGDAVAMAAGTFVQGATLELSADAPLREPYRVYLQGGMVGDQVTLACLLAATEMGA